MKQKTLLATFIVALIGLNNANAFSLFGMEIKSQAELHKEQQEKIQQKIMEIEAQKMQEQANREAMKIQQQQQNQQAQTPQNNQATSQQANDTRGLIGDVVGGAVGGGNLGDIAGDIVNGALNGNLNGALGGILDSALGKLDSQFSNIFSNSLNFINACYETDLKLDIDLGIDTTDVCAMASKLDEIKVNVCSLVGGSGTMNKGLSGFQSLCEAKQKEFKDYVSRQANNFAEWATLQNGENEIFHANKKRMRDFNRLERIKEKMEANGGDALSLHTAGQAYTGANVVSSTLSSASSDIVTQNTPKTTNNKKIFSKNPKPSQETRDKLQAKMCEVASKTKESKHTKDKGDRGNERS